MTCEEGYCNWPYCTMPDCIDDAEALKSNNQKLKTMTETIDIEYEDILFSVTFFWDAGVPGGAPDGRFEVEKIELEGIDVTNVLKGKALGAIEEKTWESIKEG